MNRPMDMKYRFRSYTWQAVFGENSNPFLKSAEGHQAPAPLLPMSPPGQ